MSKIISVENLSKKYIIGHMQQSKRTFREAVINSLNSFGSKFKHPFSKNLNASSSFEEFWALKDISFEVEQGDRIGIIGRNGAGKSTLLKVLSRITEPSTGKISLKGRVASLLEVGTGFNGELTGRENIYLNGSILGMTRSEIKRKFDDIVNFSGVEKFLDTPVKRYSSGMYVRLAFAVAAHLDPEILVVDEVLAVGDAEFQNKCLGKMQDISKSEGRTVLFVSHNMAAIESLCNNVIVIDSGFKKFEGDVKAGVHYYISNNRNSNNDVSLCERIDRTGNGKTRLVSFDITDSNNNRVTELLSGATYTFLLEFDNKTQESIDKVVIDMDINDERERTWLLFRTNFSSKHYNFKPGKNLIKCTIENFPLTVGQYHFSVYTSYADAEVLDFISYAKHFEVIGGDFFGTGSNGAPANCRLLSIVKWD